MNKIEKEAMIRTILVQEPDKHYHTKTNRTITGLTMSHIVVAPIVPADPVQMRRHLLHGWRIEENFVSTRTEHTVRIVHNPDTDDFIRYSTLLQPLVHRDKPSDRRCELCNHHTEERPCLGCGITLCLPCLRRGKDCMCEISDYPPHHMSKEPFYAHAARGF